MKERTFPLYSEFENMCCHEARVKGWPGQPTQSAHGDFWSASAVAIVTRLRVGFIRLASRK